MLIVLKDPAPATEVDWAFVPLVDVEADPVSALLPLPLSTPVLGSSLRGEFCCPEVEPPSSP